MQIINLAEIRQKKKEEARIKVEAQAKLEEMRNARGDDYNYKFFQLFDIFCRDRPFLITEWDKFINDNWR
jgi:hypothetical protein